MKRFVLLVLMLWCLCFLYGQSYNMSNGTVTVSCSHAINFYDPGGPSGNYANSMNLTQTFIAPEGQCLQVVFSSFVLETYTGSGTPYDYLTIYDGANTSSPQLGIYYGTNSPGTIVSSSGALTFVFHSDQSVNKQGWVATINCIACPEIISMGNGTVTTCNARFFDPGGPSSNYGNNQNFTQTIVSATPDMCLKVAFSSFQLQGANWSGTLNDYLIIYDGENTSSPQIGRYYGSNSPGTIISTSGALTFVFHSNGSSTYAGWMASVTCMECPNIPCMSMDDGSPCSMLTQATPFCTDENPYGVTFPSGLSGDASSFFGTNHVGCLSRLPSPAWYYMQIQTPGSLTFTIHQESLSGGGMDVDFACWGPFMADNQADFMENLCCGQYTFHIADHPNNNSTYENPNYPYDNLVDCSFSNLSDEICHIPNAQPGEWYLVIITNYYNYNHPGTQGLITFTPTANSTATTNCSLLAPMTYNGPLCEGDTLVLTCTNPQPGATYNWTGPNGWSAVTTVPTVSVCDVTALQSGEYSLQLTGIDNVVNPSHIEVSIDSMPQLTLTVSEDTICRGTQISLQAQGASHYVWSPGGSNAANRTVTPSTTTTYSVTGSIGNCSATVSHTVVVFALPTVNITTVPSNRTICKGDTAILCASGGETYMWVQGVDTIAHTDTLRVSPAANITYQVIGVSAEGCTKSTSKNIIVRSLPTASISGASSMCRGDSVQLTSSSASHYEWSTGASTRSVWVKPLETSVYTVTVTDNYGCTASDTVEVRVFLSDTTIYKDTICWNGSVHDANFNVTEILAPGNHQYRTIYPTSASCDSVVILDLTVLPMIPVVWYDTSCVSYQWRNQTYTQTGVYVDSVLDAHACLQVDTLHLIIHDAFETIDTVTACESYTWINGLTYTESTEMPSYTTTTSSLCDSVIYLHLTVYHAEHEVVEVDTCSYYTWHGSRYTEGGLFTYSDTDVHHCPYTDTLLLSLHFASPSSMTAQSCDSYEWNDSVYTESGVYCHGHEDGNGCWQVDTLHLTINRPVHGSYTVSACESYEWRGTTYLQSGLFMDSHIDGHNCVQVDTLHLTVNHAHGIAESVTRCEPFMWHNELRDTTGVYLYDYIDSQGCPCADTLRLRLVSVPELLLEEVINATCNQENGSIKIASSGGLQPYRYVYQPSGAEAEFNFLAAGNYLLQMIDSIGCTSEVSFEIDNIVHRVNLVQVTNAHCGRDDGRVEIAATGGFGVYTYQWTAPIVSDGPVAEHVRAGNYSVAVVDSNGCSLPLPFTVRDIPGPDACFHFNVSNEQCVTMVNCTEEEGLVQWTWAFGDGQGSMEWQPTHIYNDPGQYPVVLTVIDENNCLDSLELLYVIQEMPTLYLPSAFIPESEVAENRVFRPVGNSISEQNYEMLIYDRWGQLIFVSRQRDYGWDGYINGQLAPQGTYMYRITYEDTNGIPKMVKGSVLLMR